ncbi:uncharacterized protein LOC142646372 [Dermatophagoides pteronyssinus]|uniref:uncharacterized protein LOC142646372 n=1 Tax=Dermatophagoides pteronyssinus TaxID=6956 RepID=UPI003F672190
MSLLDTTPINAFLMKLLKSTFKSIKKSIDFVFYVDKFFEINKQKRTNPKWYLERFPYKPIYGLPDSLDCDQSIRQRFNECEIWSHKEWDIDKTDYFYTTKRFCCFVWDSMNCEYNIANKCDEEYSKKLKNITLESFKKCWKKIFIPGIPNDNYFCLISPSNQKTFRIIAGILWTIYLFIIISICIYRYVDFKERFNVEGLADYRHSSEPILIKYKKINEVPERPIIPVINLNAYNNINTAAVQSDDPLNKVFVQPQLSTLSSLSLSSSSITDQISDVNIIQSGPVDRMLTNSNQIL